MRIYGNESLALVGWPHLLRKTVEAVPDVDSDGSILLMGDFKGARVYLMFLNVQDVKRFICTFHREQNITGHLGLEASALPIKASHVKTSE